MHKFGTISLDKAREIVNNYDALSPEDFERTVFNQWKQMIIDEDGLSEYDISIRDALLTVYKAHSVKGKNDLYSLDLDMGLTIYELLNPNCSEFSISDACNDDMWRYITLKVIPDLTHLRYPSKSEKGSKNINKKRFYSEKRRIWIKSLWWYIHLSWQGNRESTYAVLKDNGVDNINKLIETPGIGYRLSLYRTIMKEYSTRPHNSKYFAGVTKLNNAKNKTIEPLLFENGESNYAKLLFDEVPCAEKSQENQNVEK